MDPDETGKIRPEKLLHGRYLYSAPLWDFAEILAIVSESETVGII
jgi:hypothetical protein